MRLPRPDQVDIDLGQEFRVEQRAVFGAAGIIDRIARTEIIEPVRYAGMLAPRQQQRVDQPVARNRRPLDAVKFGVDEAISNDALWITSGASAMNSRNSSTI